MSLETIKVGVWAYLGQWLNASAISLAQHRHHLSGYLASTTLF